MFAGERGQVNRSLHKNWTQRSWCDAVAAAAAKICGNPQLVLPTPYYLRGSFVSLLARETPGVKRGDHRAPSCEHGEWWFAGSDAKRGTSKWRCPTGECKPAFVWSRLTGCTR